MKILKRDSYWRAGDKCKVYEPGPNPINWVEGVFIRHTVNYYALVSVKHVETEESEELRVHYSRIAPLDEGESE